MSETKAKCDDCRLPYDDPGFADLVVPHEMWNGHVSPTGNEGGLLCPTCMVRAAHNAGVTCRATWRSGPFFEEAGNAPMETEP